MRGAKVVRRRSVTNPGESGGGPGGVNGEQADGEGPGLLTGGSATGGAPARRDVAATGPQPAMAQNPAGGPPATQPGTAADQAPAGAPPPASMVSATHPHPRRPGSARSRFALVNWRVRWRLAAIIAVPSLTAAVLGALTINGDVNNWQATGRVQHLAQLNRDVVNFSQDLEEVDYDAVELREVLDAAGRLPVVDVAVDGERAEDRRGQARDRDDGRQPPADAPVDQGKPRPGRAWPPRVRMGGRDHAGRRRPSRGRLVRGRARLRGGRAARRVLRHGGLRTRRRHVPSRGRAAHGASSR